MSHGHFDSAYFRRQYDARPWRAAGSKPLLDASRLRWLRRWVAKGLLLEIGTGYGALARKATRWFSVVGVDLDPMVIAHSFSNTGALGVAGSADALPLGGQVIDVVVCVDVVEHLPDPDNCFREVYRVLRPGGYFHLSTPNPRSFGARRKGQRSFIYRDPTHCSVHSMEEWRKRLEAAGFEEVWAGTDGLWDPPYVSWLPSRLQWFFFTASSQLAWAIAPGFRWRHGENFLWLGRRRT